MLIALLRSKKLGNLVASCSNERGFEIDEVELGVFI